MGKSSATSTSCVPERMEDPGGERVAALRGKANRCTTAQGNRKADDASRNNPGSVRLRNQRVVDRLEILEQGG